MKSAAADHLRKTGFRRAGGQAVLGARVVGGFAEHLIESSAVAGEQIIGGHNIAPFVYNGVVKVKV